MFALTYSHALYFYFLFFFLPQPYMPEEIPKSYLLMEKMIKERVLQGGVGHNSTVSWSEFVAMARECSIPEERV